MHKVKDIGQLNKWVATPNSKLPEAARGTARDVKDLGPLRNQAAKKVASQAVCSARSYERKKAKKAALAAEGSSGGS